MKSPNRNQIKAVALTAATLMAGGEASAAKSTQPSNGGHEAALPMAGGTRSPEGTKSKKSAAKKVLAMARRGDVLTIDADGVNYLDKKGQSQTVYGFARLGKNAVHLSYVNGKLTAQPFNKTAAEIPSPATADESQWPGNLGHTFESRLTLSPKTNEIYALNVMHEPGIWDSIPVGQAFDEQEQQPTALPE